MEINKYRFVHSRYRAYFPSDKIKSAIDGLKTPELINDLLTPVIPKNFILFNYFKDDNVKLKNGWQDQTLEKVLGLYGIAKGLSKSLDTVERTKAERQYGTYLTKEEKRKKSKVFFDLFKEMEMQSNIERELKKTSVKKIVLPLVKAKISDAILPYWKKYLERVGKSLDKNPLPSKETLFTYQKEYLTRKKD